MVAGQCQHGINTKGSCSQCVAHQCHTVTVTAGHLQNRLYASLLQLDAQTQTGCLQAGRLHIGDIDTVNLAPEQLSCFHLLGKIITLRRGHLSGNTKLTGFQRVF